MSLVTHVVGDWYRPCVCSFCLRPPFSVVTWGINCVCITSCNIDILLSAARSWCLACPEDGSTQPPQNMPSLANISLLMVNFMPQEGLNSCCSVVARKRCYLVVIATRGVLREDSHLCPISSPLSFHHVGVTHPSSINFARAGCLCQNVCKRNGGENAPPPNQTCAASNGFSSTSLQCSTGVSILKRQTPCVLWCTSVTTDVLCLHLNALMWRSGLRPEQLDSPLSWFVSVCAGTAVEVCA